MRSKQKRRRKEGEGERGGGGGVEDMLNRGERGERTEDVGRGGGRGGEGNMREERSRRSRSRRSRSRSSGSGKRSWSRRRSMKIVSAYPQHVVLLLLLQLPPLVLEVSRCPARLELVAATGSGAEGEGKTITS